MATGTVTSLGVGSGLDLQSILDGLKEADSRLITRKQNEKVTLEATLEEFNVVKSNLFTLKSHALDLSLASNFTNRNINVSNSSILSATAINGASIDTHSIDVNRLASYSNWQSGGVASASTSIASAATSFSYTLGDQDPVMVSVASGTTLQGLADLINNDSNNPGATASVIDTGVGDNPYRLVLKSNATGEDNRIRVTSQLTDLTLTETNGANFIAQSDTGVKPITIDATNKYIDFSVNGGPELNATIAEGTYTAGELATAVETAMETASAGTDFTVSYSDSTNKFTIAASGSTSLDLLWSSGTNAANSAAGKLGYAATDDTGALSYAADNKATLVTIDASNDQIVFREKTQGGSLTGDLTASIAQADYTSMDDLAAAIETAMESASSNGTDYDVSFDQNNQTFIVKEAGTLEELQIDWTGSSAAATLGYSADDDLTPFASSLNAEINANGTTYQRQNNSSLSDIVQGVTLNLMSTGSSTVTVSANTDDIQQNVVDMVTSLNDLIQEIADKSAYDDSGTKGPLSSITGITSLGDELTNLMTANVNTGGDITSIYDLGFEIQRDGTLTINQSTLSQALASNLDDIATLFVGDSENGIKGIADSLNNRLRDLTGSTGMIESEKQNVQYGIDSLDTQIQEDTDRLDQRYETLANQFTKLDVFMSRMQSQQDYLTSMFNSLNSSGS